MPGKRRYEGKRPFFIWDAVRKEPLPRRSYMDQQTASDRALLLASQMRVGTRLEVLRRYGSRLICQVSRHASGVLRYWR